MSQLPGASFGNLPVGGGGFQAPVTQGQGPIGGALPFGGGGGGMFGGDLAGSYANAYNSALQMNQQNYANILQGYQQVQGAQTSAQQAIGGGYNQLYNTVTGGIRGIEQSQRQALQDVYSQQSGMAAQGLTNRGLGNTTVNDSVQRGLLLDKAKADVALSNQTAQLQAGYQSQLGMAGLNYQNQAAMQNTALGNQQLQWMNSVNAQYPNAQAYTQLLQQQGAINQGNQDRAMLNANMQRAWQGNLGTGNQRTGAGAFPQLPNPQMSSGLNFNATSAPGMPVPAANPNAPLNQLTAQLQRPPAASPYATQDEINQMALAYQPASKSSYGVDVSGDWSAPEDLSTDFSG